MYWKPALSASLVALAALMVSAFTHAQTEGNKAAQQGYGDPAAGKIEVKALPAAESLSNERLETARLIGPDKDYVDASFDVQGQDDVNAGGFFLGKGGKGHLISRGGIHVANSLKLYATTNQFWIYEVEGFKSPSTGKKVYHAFWKTGPAPTSAFPVYVSIDKDNPTDFASFKYFCHATRGEKKGNMTE